MQNESTLQVTPQYQALHHEFLRLRDELASLLEREHALLHTVKPNLLALYQQKIGTWEIRCLQAQIAAAWARRRLEAARACVMTGAIPDWASIDHDLELEFLTWQQRLREAVQKLCTAEQRLSNLMPAGEARELKKLYHSLVKKLHPDVNPEQGKRECRLWQQVQDAYEASDLERLRALDSLDDAGTAAPAPLETLEARCDVLRAQVATAEEKIKTIQTQPPFPLRQHLENEEWLAARRSELETHAAQWERQQAEFVKALAALEPRVYGQPLGVN